MYVCTGMYTHKLERKKERKKTVILVPALAARERTKTSSTPYYVPVCIRTMAVKFATIALYSGPLGMGFTSPGSTSRLNLPWYANTTSHPFRHPSIHTYVRTYVHHMKRHVVHAKNTGSSQRKRLSLASNVRRIAKLVSHSNTHNSG